MQDRSVGFIGLGVMGEPMALNLVRAGIPVRVHNRSAAAVQRLAEAGAVAAASAREIAEESDIVITMLPDSPDVEAVYEGPDGLLAGVRSGHVIVDMSTISPDVARRLAGEVAGRGADLLDAPVSGGDVAARGGTLAIMVGGSEAALARVRPILEVLGKTIVHVGPSGSGQVVKACNQVVVAQVIQAVSEALVLGSSCGVRPDAILDVLGGGLAGNRVMEVRRRNFLEHDFTPGFRIELHRKDLRIALDEAARVGVALPATAAVAQLFAAASSDGHGRDDHSALLTVVERLAGHTIGQSPAEIATERVD